MNVSGKKSISGQVLSVSAHRDATVAVGVALCVVVVAIATVFIWHSSRYSDCTIVRLAPFKMVSPVTGGASSAVITVQTGNNNSTKQVTTPSSGAILLPSSRKCNRVPRYDVEPLPPSRVQIGRSTSRDWTGARDDVTPSSCTDLDVSLNRLPIGDLLGPTNYIPYRLKQSYC